jgi:hypothetical protein
MYKRLTMVCPVFLVSQTQAFIQMNAEIKQRLIEMGIGQKPGRRQQELPPIQSNGQAKFDKDFGIDRQLPGVGGRGEIVPESSPFPASSEEHRSAEPITIIAETKSSWDKVRSKAENSMETQQPQMRFPERRRRVEQQVDTRSQEQKEYEALVEKERQGEDS